MKTIVSGALDGVNKRLKDLEVKLDSGGNSDRVLRPESGSFADIVRQTVSGVRRGEELCTRVSDFGKTRVIERGEVLVIRPKAAVGASAPPPPIPIKSLQDILKEIPVNSCYESRSGGVVMKFPNENVKKEASALIESSMGSGDVIVSEPRKMLPKI